MDVVRRRAWNFSSFFIVVEALCAGDCKTTILVEDRQIPFFLLEIAWPCALGPGHERNNTSDHFEQLGTEQNIELSTLNLQRDIFAGSPDRRVIMTWAG